MKEFINKHPYLFTFFVLPGAAWGVARIVLALRGKTPEGALASSFSKGSGTPPPAKEGAP